MRCSELLRASQPVLLPADPPRRLSAQAAPPSAVAELGVVSPRSSAYNMSRDEISPFEILKKIRDGQITKMPSRACS
jgi:hypothetical protein